MQRLSHITRLAVVGVVVACVVTPAWAAKKPRPEHVTKVEAVLPAKARAQPARPRKLLVFTRCTGFVHSAIPLGAKAFEMMGQRTGAYEAVVSDDPTVFEPASLKQFDAVCMMNTTGPVFLPRDVGKLPKAAQKAARKRDAALKKSFLAFVRGGGGLVGIHAATDCMYEWADYGEMIGAYFSGHPWGSGDTVGVKLDDPAHPLCAAFGGRGFMIKDEIYQFRARPYSRQRLRVLLSLDHAKTDMKKKGMNRKDGDYAVAWVQRYRKGRVFYCSLGHNESTYWNPAVLQHYLDGIQFALGDLPVDTTPSAKLTKAYFEESQRKLDARLLDELVSRLAKYDYGQDAADLNRLAEMVIKSHADPNRRKRIAGKLAALLDTKATLAAKLFVCRQLYRVGTKEVVPQLARLLENKETADMARYALERMPDAAAGEALRKALAKAGRTAKVGIINSLGERRDPRAVDALAKLTTVANRAVAEAAILALGKIGGTKAVESLYEAKPKVDGAIVPVVNEALLGCADGLAANGDVKSAEAIYKTLYQYGEPSETRAAALKGLIAIRQQGAASLVLAALAREDRIVRTAAADAIRELTSSGAVRALAKALPDAKPEAQVLILHALADRGAREALPFATAAASSKKSHVRTAALAALGDLGDVSSAMLLANVAADGGGAEPDVARESLARLRGKDIDATLINALTKAAPKVRVELIRGLAARFAKGALGSLWKTATDRDETVRAESFKALGVLASDKDLPKLLQLLIKESSDGPRGQAEAAVVALATKVRQPSKRADAALAVFDATKGNAPARCALLRVFGKFQNDRTLEAVRSSAKDADADVMETAIRVLADWKSSGPLPDLLAVAEKGPSKDLQLVALRASIRMLGMPSDRPVAETLKMYEKALALASRTEEKKMAITGLARVSDKRAVEIIKRYQEDKALKADAESALKQIVARVRKPAASHGGGEAKAAIDGDIKTRWTTGEPMKPGMWFMLDLGWEHEVRKLVLDTTPSRGDYPRGYEVYVSNNPEKWGEPVAKGKAEKPVTEISLKPKAGRYVRIVQTGSDKGLFWSIHELKVETK